LDADKYKCDMYNYPIFKFLIQFSNLMDADGTLRQDAMQPPPTHYGTTNPKNEDSSGGDGEDEYGDEKYDELEGEDDKEGGQVEYEES
jgi:hypothetical protein